MTSILSWNIQNGRGVDGVVSLSRIAEVIEAMGKADVICLQEVSRHLALDGAGAPDQPAELAAVFPEYEAEFGIAVDADPDGNGRRWQFGNLVLSRLPILWVRHHQLPRPAAGGVRHMARQATEIVVSCRSGPLRVVNTHLEFHCKEQRSAQIGGLRALCEEGFDHSQQPPQADAKGPYRPLPQPLESVICGDFNMEVDSAEYALMGAPLASGRIASADAWTVAQPGRRHEPTCGIHDHVQWPQGPHCRDFCFVTGGAIEAIRSLRVDTQTAASDHQPIKLELDNLAP